MRLEASKVGIFEAASALIYNEDQLVAYYAG
jgi:hypothetical protein